MKQVSERLAGVLNLQYRGDVDYGIDGKDDNSILITAEEKIMGRALFEGWQGRGSDGKSHLLRYIGHLGGEYMFFAHKD